MPLSFIAAVSNISTHHYACLDSAHFACRLCAFLHLQVRSALRPQSLEAGVSNLQGAALHPSIAAAGPSPRCASGLLASASRVLLPHAAQAAEAAARSASSWAPPHALRGFSSGPWGSLAHRAAPHGIRSGSRLGPNSLPAGGLPDAAALLRAASAREFCQHASRGYSSVAEEARSALQPLPQGGAASAFLLKSQSLLSCFSVSPLIHLSNRMLAAACAASAS